jgi:PAS domain S-box-containing protein
MKKLMLVDDSAGSVHILKRSLSKIGYDVVAVCSSGEDAIRAAEENPPDAILMDVVLDGAINGIQTAEIITSKKDIPVIFLTGSNDDSIVNRILDNNPYGFLQKPYKISMLKTIIKIALQRKEMESMILKSQDKLKLSTQVLELLNMAENHEQAISDILFIIKSMTKIDEVNITLEKDETFNGMCYYSSLDESEPQQAQNSMWHEIIDKISGLVTAMDVDSSLPFFTVRGAFWTNQLAQDAAELFKSDIDQTILGEGYNAAAIIPLRTKNEMIGVLKLFGRGKNVFTYEDITFYERISASIGVTLSRHQTKWKLHKAYSRLSKLEQIINRSPVVTIGFTVKDNYRHPTFVSNSIIGFGYFPDEFYSSNLHFRNLVHPEDRIIVADSNKSMVSGEKDFHMLKYRLKTKDGQYRWVDEYLWKEKEENQTGYLQGVLVDVTNQVNANLELAENEAFMDKVLRGIKAAIIIIDPEDMIVVSMNDEAVKLFGADKETYLNKPCENLPGLKNLDTHVCTEQISGKTSAPEILIENADGTKIPASKTVLDVVWRGKLHHVVIMFDISEHKKLERQLGVAQKLESIGSLAAGIAHEINTPIQYIGDNALFFMQSFSTILKVMEDTHRFVESSPDEPDFNEIYDNFRRRVAETDLSFIIEEIPAAITQSIEGVERVASIVRAMKKFSHLDREDKQPADINIAIENTITIARNEWKYVAEISTDFDPFLPYVPCYPGDLNQVILNLIINAAHAIEGVVKDTGKKGEIKITTRNLGNAARITISDTGGGIPENIRHKIFDPFFTTKEIGKGTGQGLAISHEIIVKKHSGKVYFEVENSVGTTFYIEIPLEPEKPERSALTGEEL